jgi:hypothetical protein
MDGLDHSRDLSYRISQSLVFVTPNFTNIDIPMATPLVVIFPLAIPDGLNTMHLSADLTADGYLCEHPTVHNLPFCLLLLRLSGHRNQQSISLRLIQQSMLLPPELLRFLIALGRIPGSQRPRPLSSFSSANSFT